MKKRIVRPLSKARHATLILSSSLLLLQAPLLAEPPPAHFYDVAEDDQHEVSSSLLDTIGSTLTKTGDGLLILSASNTYSLLTDIQAGTVQLTGSNGYINNSESISGAGAFEVTGGATAHAGEISVRSLLIDGLGSTVHAGSALFAQTSSSVTLRDGGTLNIDNGEGTLILSDSNNESLLQIGGSLDGPAQAAGTLSAKQVTTNGSIIFNHTETDYRFTADINGNAGIGVYSGVTHLTGINDVGLIGLANGGLTISGSNASLTSSILFIIQGEFTVNEGTLSSEGLLMMDGSLTLTGSSAEALIEGGSFNNGKITIRDGAQMTIGIDGGEALTIGSGTSRMSLHIGGGLGEAATKAGFISASAVEGAESGGGGSVNFNHLHGTSADLNAPHVFDTKITGNMEINQLNGVTVLDAENDYTGATTVSNGTLRSGRAGALSAVTTLAVAGSGAVYDLNGFDVEVIGLALTHGGRVIGAANLTSATAFDLQEGSINAHLSGEVGAIKSGGGTVTLSGSNTYDGTTVVEGGTLVIANYLKGESEVGPDARLIINGTSGGVENSGGFVGGSGTISGSLINSGIVNPGNSPGTLRVGGDFTQTSSGTLVIEVKGRKHDRIVVSGTAFLAGKLSIQTLGGATGGKTMEFLSADGGVDGTFSSIEGGGGLFNFTVDYLANSVQLNFSKTSIFDFARGRELAPNELEIAKALDRADRKGKLGKLLDRFYSMTLDEVENSLTLLSPEQLTQIFQIGFANAQTQYNNLERRMSDVRHGSSGFSSNGLALSNSQGTLNYDGAPITNERNGLTLAGWDGKSVVGRTAIAPILEESRWGFFATGAGEWADVETTAVARGSEFTTGGVTVGADYRVCKHLVVGIAGGYANSTSDLNNGGKIEADSGRGSLYATAFSDGFYLNTAVGGAYNSYETRRGTLGGKANGSTEGGEFNALLGGGYDYQIGGFSVGPVAALQYTYLGLDSFQETGSDAPLRFSSQSQDSLKSSLGLKASYAWSIGGILIRPEVRALWQHEFLDSTASLESAFVGGAGVFTVNGTEIGRDGLLLDAGVNVQFNPAVSVYAGYTGELGRTNYSSNSVNGGVRINF